MAEKVFESNHQWNLRSSNGCHVISGNFKSLYSAALKSVRILADVHITSDWVARETGQYDYTKLNKDFAIDLEQVIIDKECVLNLINDLEKWSPNTGKIDLNLCHTSRSQKLNFYIGPPTGSSLEKNIVRLEYSGEAFYQGVWTFGIDQSCIRIFADELYVAFNKLKISTE